MHDIGPRNRGAWSKMLVIAVLSCRCDPWAIQRADQRRDVALKGAEAKLLLWS
jgi:hypothetical protein